MPLRSQQALPASDFRKESSAIGVGLGGVDAPGGQILVGLVLRLVLLDLGGVREMLLGVGRMNGRDLHADHLALEVCGGRAELLVLGADHGGRRVVVFVGEIDRLLALVGDRHRVHDRIDLLRGQRRNEAVPRDRRQHAVKLLLGTDRIDDLDLPAAPFAGRILLVEWRIGLRRKADLDLLGACRIGARKRDDCRCGDRLQINLSCSGSPFYWF